jgi:hypothetical protein
MRLIPSQKYFTFQNQIYQPEKGVSMGSIISSTTAEIFLKPFKNIHKKQLLETKNNILHTLCRRYCNYIRHQKNPSWPHQYRHKPNTYRHKAQPYIWKQWMCKFPWSTRNSKTVQPWNWHIPHTDHYRHNHQFSFKNNPIEHKVSAVRHHITRMQSLILTPKRRQKNEH